MKTILLITGLTLLIIGCINSTKEKTQSKSSVVFPLDSNKKSESSLVYVSTYALWGYDFDTITKVFKPIRLRNINQDTLTAQGVEIIVNKTWPKVQIKYEKTSKDTVYISIPDSEVLTQQMGTTGAEQFMASTTYSFTELTGIKYVSYTFEEGDHATPGVYSRNSWDEKNNH